jgi:ribosomal-protein-alanine N-acetyltransferase
MLRLRNTVPEDIETFFTFQLDEEANHMAAFTQPDPHDKEAYMTKWAKNLANNGISMYTIIYDGQIVGSVLAWPLEGEPQISYWLGKEFWGKGIATQAAKGFLELFSDRPIYGRIAFDNTRSMRVLTKCGFKQQGADKYYSNARKQEIEEWIFKLES